MKKINHVFTVFILLFSVIVSQLIPVFAETATESVPVITTEMFQESSKHLGEKSDQQLLETNDSSGKENESQTEKKIEKSVEEKEQTSQSSDTEKQANSKAAIRKTRANLSNQVKMLEWKISNSKGEEITETVSAVSNQSHDLSFKIQLDQMIIGDTFTIDIPHVGGASNENDHWYMQSTDWIEITDDQGTVFYRYRIQTKQGTNTQEIQFEAKETSLSTIELNLEFPGMLSNFVKTAGVFPVTFGKDAEGNQITKNLKFEVTDLNAANGFSFKYNVEMQILPA